MSDHGKLIETMFSTIANADARRAAGNELVQALEIENPNLVKAALALVLRADSESIVRFSALRGLRRLADQGETRVADEIAIGIGDESPAVRKLAIKALAHCSYERSEAISWLLCAVGDPVLDPYAIESIQQLRKV